MSGKCNGDVHDDLVEGQVAVVPGGDVHDDLQLSSIMNDCLQVLQLRPPPQADADDEQDDIFWSGSNCRGEKLKTGTA